MPGRWLLQNSVTLCFFLVYDLSPEDRKAGLAEVSERLREGKLVHSIARHLPLERIAEAHDLVESGAVMGNVVLDIA